MSSAIEPLKRAVRRVAPWSMSIAIVALLVVWWDWLVSSGRINRIVLPEPSAVGHSLRDVVTHNQFWRDLAVTLGEVAIGFAIGGLLALTLAILGVAWPPVRKVVAPYVVVIQAVPKIVLIPLLGVWIGTGFTSTAIVVSLVTFFPVYVNADLGLRAVDGDGVKLLRSLSASTFEIFRMYRLPSALPLVFTGAKTAVNYSIIAAITSEFMGAREGLGYRITTMAARLQLSDLYAAVVVTSLVAGAVYVLLEIVDRRVVFWRD